MSNTVAKKLFKVAREFNVSTQTIVDELAKHNLEVANKPNTKILPEMYEVLEKVYGIDKQRNIRHQKERDEYTKQRETMRINRNEAVSVDNLAPIDDVFNIEPLPDEPAAEKPATIEPSIDELAPIEPEEVVPTPKKQETVKPQEDIKPLEEVKAEPATEEVKDDKPETKEPITSVESKDETAKVEASAEEPVSDKAATTDVVESKENQETATNAGDVSEKHEATKEVADNTPNVVEEQKERSETETVENVVEGKVDSPSEDVEKTETEKPKKVRQPERAHAEEDGVIRGRANKLEGPKVMGTITFTQDKPTDSDSANKKRKKRKRKGAGSTAENTLVTAKGKVVVKDVPADKVKPSIAKSPVKKAGDNEISSKDKKKGKKGKKGGSKEITSSDVENKMRETMQKMQGGGTVGKKRQKRRRDRKEERTFNEQLQEEQRQSQMAVLEVTEFVTASDLADLLNVNVNEIIMKCMSIGMMVTLNQRLDANTIELLATEYDREVTFVDATQIMESDIEEIEDSEEDLVFRAPIVTVMGHVDHGKTSLLDYIRKERVADGEAGGITQHIGAYQVKVNEDKLITFLDTPGYEAFTAMRSRGAQATDVVILVVAADDAVMPQTKEAINHAKAAGVPIVVAMNKIDKAEANPDKIMSQLAEENVVVEDWGGTNQCAQVSAKTGLGIQELLDKVLIEAELLDLKANPSRRAEGIVLEARLDKGKGVVANVLVQKGTLNVGDPIVAGASFGKVRAMSNDSGVRVDTAGPSYPIELLGFQNIPQAGDRLIVPKDEKTAREISNQRQQIKREQDIRRSSKHLSLDEISKRMAAGELNELNIILKADVDGSIEAISGSLQKLGNEEVSVNIIHTGAGAISESDVLLASASDAIIIGFQVRPTINARKIAEKESIEIRLYSVIYHALEEVTATLEGMLSPDVKEVINGNVEVRETFKVPGVGTVAGCYVLDGKVERNTMIRLIRDGVVIYQGELNSLKRFKDDVKEVKAGFECGLGIKNFNDIKVGDIVEPYSMVEEKRVFE
jgi:translation initiation factor IF-2